MICCLASTPDSYPAPVNICLDSLPAFPSFEAPRPRAASLLSTLTPLAVFPTAFETLAAFVSSCVALATIPAVAAPWAAPPPPRVAAVSAVIATSVKTAPKTNGTALPNKSPAQKLAVSKLCPKLFSLSSLDT